MTYAVRCRPLHAGPLPMTHNDSQRRGVEGREAGEGGQVFSFSGGLKHFQKSGALEKHCSAVTHGGDHPSVSGFGRKKKEKKKVKGRTGKSWVGGVSRRGVGECA